MATTWGPAEGHLQVGIDCWTSTPTASSTIVKVYLRVYVRTSDNWRFDDMQDYRVTGTGGGSGSFNNTLNGDGVSKLIYSHDMNASISYDGGPTFTWTASISDMYNGGTPSHTRSLTLPARPPSAPNTPGVPTASTITATGATLTWAAPASNGRALDRNAGQVSRNSAFTQLVTSWDVTGWSTSRSVTGLPKGTTLYARVRARNAVGWSTWSGARVFTTGVSTPGAVAAPTVDNVAATTARLSWYPPNDTGGQSITRYEIQRATSSAFTDAVTVSATVSPASLSGLLPGTTYYTRVRAVSAAGAGAWSPAATFKTLSGVRVGDGTRWRDAIVWVGNGSTWVLAQVKTGDGSSWK